MNQHSPQLPIPVWEIYAAYEEIMRGKKRGDTPLPQQLHDRFGLADWQWSRLKVIVETAHAGNTTAAAVIKDIDAGRATVAAAYRVVKRQQADQRAATAMPDSVDLRAVYNQALRVQAYAQATFDAVRLGAAVATDGMTPKDVHDCVIQIRAAGLRLKATADLLSRSLDGKK